VTSSAIAAMSAQSVREFWAVVAVLTIGWLALGPFFPRRIGGAGGGSEKAIVGFIWVLSAIGLAFYLFHQAGESTAVG
jgi:hypothetical protein